MRSVRRRATAAEPEIGYNTSIWLIDSLTDAYISSIYSGKRAQRCLVLPVTHNFFEIKLG